MAPATWVNTILLVVPFEPPEAKNQDAHFPRKSSHRTTVIFPRALPIILEYIGCK
jgi:hypothetical protein